MSAPLYGRRKDDYKGRPLTGFPLPPHRVPGWRRLWRRVWLVLARTRTWD